MSLTQTATALLSMNRDRSDFASLSVVQSQVCLNKVVRLLWICMCRVLMVFFLTTPEHLKSGPSVDMKHTLDTRRWRRNRTAHRRQRHVPEVRHGRGGSGRAAAPRRLPLGTHRSRQLGGKSRGHESVCSFFLCQYQFIFIKFIGVTSANRTIGFRCAFLRHVICAYAATAPAKPPSVTESGPF